MLYRLLSVFIRPPAIAIPDLAVMVESDEATISPGKDDPLAGLYRALEDDLRAAGYLA
ncbi:hypothetical protein HCU64_04375 [Methylobacterium sp. C25]|uniref:hypothetical protein n=1 Tax=Methylobacterium sp. C25 TaxID=2721622 RepID=UPI001F2E1AF3|nr:hypothetical protein [Methylobacterium sp. C25]MCE4222978.1 hypothetical protein [Methylobacterium sp. C25]